MFFNHLSSTIITEGFPTIAQSMLQPCRWIAAALLAFASGNIHAAASIHLLGFVDRLCPAAPHCFELSVKPEFHAILPARIKVRFGADTRIFDPENYQLTLQQQNIVPGSHLRMLIEAEDGDEANAYRASFIWIGD